MIILISIFLIHMIWPYVLSLTQKTVECDVRTTYCKEKKLLKNRD